MRIAIASLQTGHGTAARVLTPSSYYVESLTFSPDGQEIAFAASPGRGFMSQYTSRIYTVPVTRGTSRTVVEWKFPARSGRWARGSSSTSTRSGHVLRADAGARSDAAKSRMVQAVDH